MSWDKVRATERIRRLMQSVPTAQITIERFADQYFPHRLQERNLATAKGESLGSPILKLPYHKAILVDGVHVYANLINFHEFLAQNDNETEISHQRALQFLHLHYSACDALIREFDLQRVDYHGSRLHAVVLTPTGPENAKARALRAISFAEALDRLINDANNRIAGGRFGSQLRVGIDRGQSVAINSGRGAESEPLFLGDPANYAAKLADGDEPGLYLSDRIRQDLDAAPVGGFQAERNLAVETSYRDHWYRQAQMNDRAQRANAQLMADVGLYELLAPDAVFRFHYHKPPLRSMQFQELVPSRTVRMSMVAIFADLDGFTRYVSDSIASGNVQEMVARLHVMRGEMTNVLRDDFGGKKVRYIGDCLQGVLAEGTAVEVNETESIDKAVRCVAAFRSSFLLCDRAFGASSLGLGIGVEIGQIPVTRLGNRGDFAVRCATGCATSIAEDEQGRCNGEETAIGPTAFERSSVRVKAMFGAVRKIPNLLYEDVGDFLDAAPAAPAVLTPATKHRPPLRAHSCLDTAR